MLIRPHDAAESDAQWRSFVVEQGFGHFAVVGGGAIPVVVPTQFVLLDDAVVFHLAAANPVFEALEATPRALMSVAGDWAYVPGAWRTAPGEDASLGIPTTYYAAVQLSGPVLVIDEADEIAQILRTQLGAVEPDDSLQDPIVHQKRFRAIRGLRLSIDDVRAKFKYGANADPDQRAAITDRLRERGRPGDVAAANRVPRQ